MPESRCSVNIISCAENPFKALLSKKNERKDDVIMSLNKEFDFFIDELLARAVKEFKETDQYELLKEKLDIMDGECESMFTKEEKQFATECFEGVLA